MEIPYNGRAILNDDYNQFVITIPTEKNWFVIVFLGAWLGGWAMGEVFALVGLSGMMSDTLGPANLFIFFWLCGWTAGGIMAIKVLLWNLMGKEIITFGQGQVTIAKKGALFSKPKTYDLQHIKKMRVQAEVNDYGSVLGRRANFGSLNASNGVLRFDYGMKTIKFANGIDEAEANFILERLKSKRILTADHF